MSTITFPTEIKPQGQVFYLEAHTQTQESLFTRTKTVYGLSGHIWKARFEYNLLDKDEFQTLLDFIYKCRGQLNEFKVGDFLREEKQVTSSEPLLINNARLRVSLADCSYDYVVIRNRLKRVVAVIDPTGYGECGVLPPDYTPSANPQRYLDFEPPIPNAASLSALNEADVSFDGKGTFRLKDDRQAANFRFDGVRGSGYIVCEEVV